MRVIYDSCAMDPWLNVAQELQQKHGLQPVYWLGYYKEDAEQSVKSAFPEVLFQSYYHGWSGKFPDEISAHFGSSHLDIDFLNEIANYELQAMRMMDRMDPDRNSFNFLERQRHFRNLLRHWLVVIDRLKPDLVITPNIPHRAYDYALYLLCKHHKIKHITFRGTLTAPRLFLLDNVHSIGEVLKEKYPVSSIENMDVQSLESALPTDIADQLIKVKQDYDKAEPVYMKAHVTSHAKSSSAAGLFSKMVSDIKEQHKEYFGQEGFVKEGMTFLKQRNVPIEKRRVSVGRYALLKLKGNRYKNRLKKYYSSLVTEPDWNKDFVLFNLHYQPEMTSNPSGDIFVDQALCIDVLSRNIPGDWLIYVKEHKSQFYAHQEGHTSRLASFYDDLLKNPRVRLLPLSTDPFECIRKAKAVSTITGTTGWEAMVIGKPVIIFGLAWYEQFRGVLKITDEESASKINSFIEQFQYNYADLLTYLKAVADCSLRAYFNPSIHSRMSETKEECEKNLFNAVSKHLKLTSGEDQI